MKMKKILAAILLAAMLLTLAACGNSGAGTVPPVGQTGGNGGNGGDNGGDNTNDFPKFKTANTSEVVVTAENGCVITITPATYYDNYVDFKVNFKNATEESKTLDVGCMAINGTMVNGYLHMEVDSGATDFDVISFSYDELRTLGIFQIATMDILMNIINEEWITEETHSIQVKSDTADTYEEDPQAYYNAVTSQKAQSQLEYKVIVNEDIREELGTDLYLESKVFMKSRYGEYLKMEVVNEGSQMRYVRIGTEMVNGMPANSASEYFTIFPGKKAVFSIDMEWALPKTLREAFEMDEIATAVIYADMYNCTENGSMDWNDDGEYKDMNFTVPGVTAAPNMSGTVVYEENGLKITAKAPVVDVFSDEYREAYVYLIFENVGDMDLYLRESDEKEATVNGIVPDYYYFQNPSYLYMGDRVICYLEVDNMDVNSIYLPMTAEDNDDSSDWWEVELNIQF